MVFSSHIFLFYFLPLALLLYYAAPRAWKSLVLTGLSYVFYGWWNPWYTLLMLGSTIIDYWCGKRITAPGASDGQRKRAMWISVGVNLSILGFFKYFWFFGTSASALSARLGAGAIEMPSALFFLLPVGISFYTFQSMSYSIDLYRGHARPARNFIDFACYVSMFPQLVAGPIVRYGSVAEQLRSRAHSLWRGLCTGLRGFNYGFAKKIILANPMGAIADACFGAGRRGVEHTPIAWLGVVAYAFQIYFDFSGYSDMALGIGPDVWVQVSGELQLALQIEEHHGILAAMAHLAFEFPARLSLHSAGGEPRAGRGALTRT